MPEARCSPRRASPTRSSRSTPTSATPSSTSSPPPSSSTPTKSNVDLAQEELSEAQQRFPRRHRGQPSRLAGPVDSLSRQNDQYISALYQHNVAKLSLARALGVASDQLQRLSRRQVIVADEQPKQDQTQAQAPEEAPASKGRPRPAARSSRIFTIVLLLII